MTVPDLLHALAALPPSARAAAERALLPVMIDGYGRGGVAYVGGMLRAKTFTWDDPNRPGASIGGGAGFLVDGHADLVCRGRIQSSRADRSRRDTR